MERFASTGSSPGVSALGAAGTVLLVALSAFAVTAGAEKVLVIGWVAFAAMALGAWLGARADETDPHRLVWGYGLASGAMITSAAMFLVPQAIGLGIEAGAPQLGGVGIAAGVVVGYSSHTIGHRLTHLDVSFDVSTAEITAHALSAGLIIGLVYGSMPTLGLLLGLAIVSHKGPAGYAAARRLVREGRSPAMLLLPASGVGLAALAVTLFSFPTDPTFRAVVFGFAAGIFLHVAMDFLPHCETGSEVHDAVTRTGHDHDHSRLDALRQQAVLSTAAGGLAVAAAWLLLQ